MTEVPGLKLDKVTGVRLKDLKTERGKRIWIALEFSLPSVMCRTRRLFKGVIDMDENGYILQGQFPNECSNT